jgi:DIE2/ALG10 family
MKSKKSANGEQQLAMEEKKSHGSLVFQAVLVIYTILTFLILWLIDKTQPESYLDEVFHVPQAQVYCQGNFTYVSISNLKNLKAMSVIAMLYFLNYYIFLVG